MDRDVISKTAERKEIIPTQKIFILAWKYAECFRILARCKNSRLYQFLRLHARIQTDEGQGEQNRLFPARIMQVIADQPDPRFTACYKVTSGIVLFKGKVHKAIAFGRS